MQLWKEAYLQDFFHSSVFMKLRLAGAFFINFSELINVILNSMKNIIFSLLVVFFTVTSYNNYNCCSSLEASTIRDVQKDFPVNQYLLPENHKLKSILHSIFTDYRVIKNPANFRAAGFRTISLRPKGSLRIAKHPLVKGYLFKVYLTDETDYPLNQCNEKFILRCKNSRAVNRIIKQYHLNRFSVPPKWLYSIQLPSLHTAYVLIARDMQLVPRSRCMSAWREKMNKNGLKQLYTVFHAGYSSTQLASNIPYTKKKKFSFIDLETCQRQLDLTKVDRYLSHKLRPVWRKIVKNNQTFIKEN